MKYLLLVSLIIIFSGCATNSLSIKVTDPAPVTIPSDIKNIGIINRTNTLAPNNAVKIADEILTLEMLTIDSTASLQAINGLYYQLQQNPRFDRVINIPSPILDNLVTDNFSQPLLPDDIRKICSDNKLDAVWVLEFFDTNTSVKYSVVNETYDVLGQAVKVPRTGARVITNVFIGWRIYDASGTILFDEFSEVKGIVSEGEGVNPLKAIMAITGQKSKVENMCRQMGIAYAYDLLPYTHPAYREYYVKGSQNMKTAKRMAQVGQWNDAEKIWRQETDNRKYRVAGRAFYNMAIVCEINGNIDSAIYWASHSAVMFKNRKARKYVRVLQSRKRKLKQLQRQQQNL